MRKLEIKSLDKKWCDKDEIMLHACFQLLEDFVDEEKGDTHCDYDSHKEFVDQVRFLYSWWQTRKLKPVSDDLLDEDDMMLILLMKIRTGLWT